MTADRPPERTWFDRGSKAVSALTSGKLSGYECPLCGRLFNEGSLGSGTLTKEHAPPDWFGGGRIALTCFWCNSGAGATLDVQMQRYDQIASFDRRDMATTELLRARIEIEGHSLNADIRAAGGTYEVFYPQPINNRESWSAAREIFDLARNDDEVASRPVSIEFPLLRHNPRLASVGWLRSAYVVAFAAFGYRYTSAPELQVVRNQISSPGIKAIDLFLGIDTVTPRDTRNIYMVFEPAELSCLMVQMGGYTIFLPPLGFGTDFYERIDFARLQALCNEGIPARSHHRIQWPREPMHSWDFAFRS